MSGPRIIRTVEEHEDLHTETVVLNRRGNLMRAKNIWPHVKHWREATDE